MLGGLFLIYKSTTEIHAKLEGEEHERETGAGTVTFSSVIVQIVLLDIVFSLDSVITAIGMTTNITIAVVAVMISIGIMLVAAKPLADFVNRHPTVKILALSFLLLIGMTLVAEGLDSTFRRGTSTSRWRSRSWWKYSTCDCARRANRSICTSNSTTRMWCRSPHALAAASARRSGAGAVR